MEVCGFDYDSEVRNRGYVGLLRVTDRHNSAYSA